jgi:hypothetical protein
MSSNLPEQQDGENGKQRTLWASVRSVADAEQQLRELGVANVDYRDANLFTVNMINQVIFEMHFRGAELIPSVKTDSSWFDANFGLPARDIPALFDHQATALVINPNAEFWSSESVADRITTLAVKEGYWATEDPLHPIRHEYGHFLHCHGSKPIYLRLAASPVWESRAQKQTARRVSRYAAQDPGEFVAETFVGLFAGKSYDEEVMALYKYFGGPLL